MIDVVFHRLATREYEDAINWYSQRSARAADRFQAAVDQAIDRILAGPEALPITLRKYRWVRAGRFPHILIFRSVGPSEIMVVTVAHTSRRPGYWRWRK